MCIFYAFLPEMQEGFLFAWCVYVSLCDFRSCLNTAIMLAFWKQNVSAGMCRTWILFLWCMYGVYLVKGEAVNEKEDS